MSWKNRINTLAGWLVFAIALIVYFLSAERTGSLWDCGEFILGAYKLQVVHPPGAPLFLLVGRLFTWFAEIFSNNPADIAFAVNLLSGLCSAFAAAFVAWSTYYLGKLTLVGREGETNTVQEYALGGAGIVSGLTTAFCTSIWFSAVEGEVYAMSTFFTTITFWSMIRWYTLPNEVRHDRWLVFTAYMAGLSIGVHLLSLLTFPALAIFYYFKKFQKHTLLGALVAGGVGTALIGFIQIFIIVGIPKLWSAMELLTVNNLGMPFHSGLIPVFLIIATLIFFGLRYAHQRKNAVLQQIIVGATLVVIGFSTFGMVVIRANASPPINMNNPYDAMRLLPYLNREQYGERALLRGPSFKYPPAREYISKTETDDRWGRVDDRYEVVDQKISYEFKDQYKMLFPRMSDYTQGRPRLYKMWMGLDPDKDLPARRPDQFDNLSFFFNYQVGWMYWRYFMWNFSGRQNGVQGYYPWDKSAGHWITGIGFLDRARLGFDKGDLPEAMATDKGRNTYFLLPFLFGLIGLFWHARRRQEEFLGLLALFLITGLGIIVYSNQPPNEPRERDYVLVGSFFIYSIWIGMSVLALFQMATERFRLNGIPAVALSFLPVLIAPVLMGTQNFDDHSRRLTTGARDYASNFLESTKPNAIIFTYGDNDTYPLWYAQEVEGIRPDVRVINLSLIAVDWYIDLLRRKINESPAVNLTLPQNAIRGKERNQVFYYNKSNQNPPMDARRVLEYIGERHPGQMQGYRFDYHYPTQNVYIPVDKEKFIRNGLLSEQDTANMVDRIPVNLGRSILKDELAILDILASNLGERPIYFAVTCRREKLLGLQNYMQLEGLGLQVVPVRSDIQQGFGLVGFGRVDADAVYENVMNKFRWGNFDKYDLFVDHSYAPSVQSHQLVMLRAANQFIDEGETEKGLELLEKYFEVFPHMNFPYDYRSYFMLQSYFEADAYDQAKPHLELLADELEDRLQFYSGLDQDILNPGFKYDYDQSVRTFYSMIMQVRQNGDTTFADELDTRFAPYKPAMPEPNFQN